MSMIDLARAFDCLEHDLLLAKLNAIGIYLQRTDRKQRVKVSIQHLVLLKVGVLLGSALGPHLFNIYINNIFHLVNHTQVSNYADNTTLP